MVYSWVYHITMKHGRMPLIYIYCQCPWDRKLAIVICEACGTAIVKLRPPELNDFVVASSQPAGQEALWRAKGEAWEVR
jgi:hypothetical protein